MNVYFILCDSIPEPIVKIGKTTNIKQRVRSIATSTPFNVRLIALCEDIEEKELHDKFNHLRYKNEWFRFTEEIQEFIELYRVDDADVPYKMTNSELKMFDIDGFMDKMIYRWQNFLKNPMQTDYDFLEAAFTDDAYQHYVEIFNKPLDYEFNTTQIQKIYSFANIAIERLKIIMETKAKAIIDEFGGRITHHDQQEYDPDVVY